MPTPLVKTTNIADMPLSGSFGSCTYICCFGPWTVFNRVPGEHPTAPEKFFFLLLDSITSNKRIHNFFIFLGGGWSCLRPWSKPKISLIRHFQACSEVVSIFGVLGRGRFLTVCQEGTLPPRKLFFGFSIVLLLTSPFIIFLYFWGWLIIPTAFVKITNITDTLFSYPKS